MLTGCCVCKERSSIDDELEDGNGGDISYITAGTCNEDAWTSCNTVKVGTEDIEEGLYDDVSGALGGLNFDFCVRSNLQSDPDLLGV